ncbi:hypothetical protein NP493_317g02106 [Ridgeia piscesae]|uniref:Uncharacterized protein n=1 Tax=Ridgeia piscesae TaxID=27915 RepID=A0AAD9L4M7_RIDPI|nr:hypothetical protein NP493_317g02106 [Ridgeia piscesae]
MSTTIVALLVSLRGQRTDVDPESCTYSFVVQSAQCLRDGNAGVGGVWSVTVDAVLNGRDTHIPRCLTCLPNSTDEIVRRNPEVDETTEQRSANVAFSSDVTSSKGIRLSSSVKKQAYAQTGLRHLRDTTLLSERRRHSERDVRVERSRCTRFGRTTIFKRSVVDVIT